MPEEKFYKFGLILHRFRLWIAIFWSLIFAISLFTVFHLENSFKETGFKDPHSESAETDTYINSKLTYGEYPFIVLYKSDKWIATDANFQKEIRNSLDPLKNFYVKNKIIYPTVNNKQISKDKHSAYATILFKNNKTIDDQFIKQFKETIKKPPHLNMQVGGEILFTKDMKNQTRTDLYKSEFISTPVTIITLLFIFGSIVAASLPLLLSGFFVLLILTVLFSLGHVISLSIFTLNIAILLGLCLNIDYGLFIINRFRIEMRRTHSVEQAIAITEATAGKAVFFSGLAVFVSLSTLLFFPINIMFSVGIGGITAVALSVAISIILLPAILSFLGKRINSFSIPFLTFKTTHFWTWLATTVIQYKWSLFVVILVFLFGLSYPFFHVAFGTSDATILPSHLESRQFFDNFKENFGDGKITPISVMVKTEKGNILSENNLNQLYNLSQKIKKNPNVAELNSIVYTKPLLSKDEYYKLYHTPEKYQPAAVKQALATTTSKKFTVINVVSKYNSNSDNTIQLIKDIRAMDPGKGLTIKVTGSSANTLDALKVIFHLFMYALIFIIIFTYIILLIMFRSLFLPLKAIIMNIISLCASYGVLTFVFQEGYFHSLLNFVPQGMLDINLIIIIFCSLFGFSMDYEVFLLSRIKEEYEKTHDTRKSIICGIEHSSRIITSAALIVMVICFSFMSAGILIVKEFGLGIAVAIFVDAFLIRTILVPSTMAIIGKWNWYLPNWLDRILPKL